MVSSDQFRLGNIIYSEKYEKAMKINGIHRNHLIVQEDEENPTLEVQSSDRVVLHGEKFKGLKLTKMNLLLMNFSEINDKTLCLWKKYYYDLDTCQMKVIDDTENGYNIIPVEFVHEFQNLFFALNQKEYDRVERLLKK